MTKRMMTMVLLPMMALASGDYTWETEPNGEGTVSIVGIVGWPTGFVRIPETIDGKTVTELGWDLFEDYDDITEIVVPDTVTVIGGNVFRDCDVEKVTLPHGLEEIGCWDEDMYLKWTSEDTLFAPGDWRAEGAWSVFNANHLKSVTFSGGRTSNDDGTYYIKDGMLFHRVTFGSYVKGVPDDRRTVVDLIGFAGWGKRGKVTVPDGVNGIAASVFEDLDAVTEISLPSSLIALGGGYGGGSVFGWMCCDLTGGLGKIEVRGTGSPYKVIDNSLVDTRTKTLVVATKNTVIPSDGSITKISRWAFSAAPEKVVIPDCVTDIAPSAFCCSDYIRRIELGAGAVNVLGGAFADIPLLAEFVVSEGNPKYEVVNNCLVEKTGLRAMISPTAHPKQYECHYGKWTYYEYDCHVPYFCRGIVDMAFKEEEFVRTIDLPKDLRYVPMEDYYNEGVVAWSDVERIVIADCANQREMESSQAYRELCDWVNNHTDEFEGFYWTDEPQVAVRARGRVVADGFGRYVPGSKVVLTAKALDAGMSVVWLDEQGVTNAVGETFVLTMPREDVLFTAMPVRAESVDGSKVVRVFNGTSTVEKKYAAGAKVALTAKGPKGAVFAGWYLDADYVEPFVDLLDFAGVDFRSAKVTYKRQPGCDPDAVYARFVDKTEDTSITISFDHDPWVIAPDGTPTENTVMAESLTAVKLSFKGLPKGVKYANGLLTCDFKKTVPGSYKVTVTGKNASNFAVSRDLSVVISNKASAALPNLDATAVYVAGAGVVVDESLMDVTAASGWTVTKISGLPSGMKAVKDKKTGLWSVLGVPTKPGPLTVTVIAVNEAKQQSVANVTIRVDPLPAAAFGDFSGYTVRGVNAGTSDVLTAYRGRLTFSVSSVGKISAKIVNGDGSSSFQTVGWDEVDADGRYVAEMENKKGARLFLAVNPNLVWTRRQDEAGIFSPKDSAEETVEFVRTTPYTNKKDALYAVAQDALRPYIGKYNLVCDGEATYHQEAWMRYRLEPAVGKAALSLTIDAKGRTKLAGTATFVRDDGEAASAKVSAADVFFLDDDEPVDGMSDFCIPLKIGGKKYTLMGSGDLDDATLHLKAFAY